MNKRFINYKNYKKYLLSLKDINDIDLDTLIQKGYLVDEKRKQLDGYMIIGFRKLTKEEFNKSKIKITIPII